MKRNALRMSLLLLLVGACGPRLSPPRPDPRAKKSAPPPTASASVEVAPQQDPALIVSVAAVRPPQKLVLDGDLGEWGSLLPPPPTLEKQGAKKEKPKAPPPPNPRDAVSHLALAFTPDAVLIAAELGEPAREGIWLGIGSPAPPLPLIGEFGRGNSFEELRCTANRLDYSEGSSYDSGEPNPPEVIAACRALLDRHAKLKATHEKRFTKVFKLDREGVRVDTDGTLSPIKGATAVWKPGPKGATVEVSLPFTAMPRVAEAPLSSLRLVARAAPSPKPPNLADQSVEVSLPDAFSLEPYGELRARLFQSMNADAGETSGYVPPSGLSYLVSDALHVESVGWGGEGTKALFPREQMLYQKQASLGDVEIGHATEVWNLVAVFKKGKLVDLVQAYGSPRTVFPRGGELHWLSYSSEGYSGAIGMFSPPSWSVVAIAADGSHRDPMETNDEGGGVEANCHGYESVSVLTSKRLDSFGYRATCVDGASGPGGMENVGIEVTWRWDGTTKKYKSVRRVLPAPKGAATK